MALNIVTALEPMHINNIITFIYGDPGLGKTSLAFSSAKPILFDFDNGAHRSGKFRGDSVKIQQWSEVAIFTANDLADYNTIIIDTVGRCLDMIVDNLRLDGRNTRRGSNELSIQGYGKLARTFTDWLKMLRSFGKDIVLLAHAAEDKDGDNVIKRPDMVGSSKKEVYKVADMMAYMTTQHGTGGQVRMLNFMPSPAYHAKDSGAVGNYIMKDLDAEPNQLEQIIQQAKNHINSLSDEALALQKELDEFRTKLMESENAESVNDLGKSIGQHQMRKQMLADLKGRASALGLEHDKDRGFFMPEPSEEPTGEAA